MQKAHYSNSFSVIQRSKKDSVVKKAAYNSRSRLYCERERKHINYKAKQDLLGERILAPKGAKGWVFNRESHYNRVEKQDKRVDAQLGRNNRIALYHFLTLEQNTELLERYLKNHFVNEGMVADYAIHAPEKDGDQRNIHAHVILSMRKLDGDNFSKKKTREWNNPKRIEQWREAWEIESNQYFRELGFNYYVDRRSNEAQGIDTLPQKHEGKRATHLKRRKGVTVARSSYNELVDNLNQTIEQTAMLNREADLLKRKEKEEHYLRLLEQVLTTAEKALDTQKEEARYWIARKELDGVMAEREAEIVAKRYTELHEKAIAAGEAIGRQIRLLEDEEGEEVTFKDETKQASIEHQTVSSSESQQSPEKEPEKQQTDYEKWLQECERKSQLNEANKRGDNQSVLEPEPPDYALDRTSQPLIISDRNRGVADNTEREALTKAERVRDFYKSTKNRKPKSAVNEYRLKLMELTANIDREALIRKFRQGSPVALNYERLIRDYLRRKGFSNTEINRAIRRASPAVYKKSREYAQRYARRLNEFMRNQQRKYEQEQKKKRQQKQEQNKRRKQQKGRSR